MVIYQSCWMKIFEWGTSSCCIGVAFLVEGTMTYYKAHPHAILLWREREALRSLMWVLHSYPIVEKEAMRSPLWAPFPHGGESAT